MEPDLHESSRAPASATAPAAPDRTGPDPYRAPQYSFGNRLRRQLWSVAWILLYRPSPRIAHAWRAWLLRCFGARLGPRCRLYPASRIWAPWNLTCEDSVWVSDRAEIYNPAPMHLASHAILSQDAFVCGATHNFNDPAFPVVSYPMRLGRYSWIAARASVCPGVNVGDGAILGLGSVATADLEPWSMYAGVPARKLKERDRIA